MDSPHIVPAPGQQRSAGGIGASEVAAAIGLSPYARPIDVWLQHTGRAKPFEGNEATFMGHVFEPVIRALYVEKNQVSVHVPPESLWHPSIDFLKATPDGIVVDATGRWQWVGPQCKNVGFRQAERWEDGAIPEEYVVQGIIEMSVTQLARVDFAVVVGGQHYEQPTLHHDPDLMSDVLGELDDFWRRCVLKDVAPVVDGSASFKRYLLSKMTKREVIEATSVDMPRIERWREVVRDMAALKAEEKEIKNRILAELVDRGGNVLATPYGKISVGAGKKNTAWKAVAETVYATRPDVDLIDRELTALLADGIANLSAEAGRRIDVLRAQLRLMSVQPTLADLVAANTKISDAPINRPRSWTTEDDNQEG